MHPVAPGSNSLFYQVNVSRYYIGGFSSLFSNTQIKCYFSHHYLGFSYQTVDHYLNFATGK